MKSDIMRIKPLYQEAIKNIIGSPDKKTHNRCIVCSKYAKRLFLTTGYYIAPVKNKKFLDFAKEKDLDVFEVTIDHKCYHKIIY